MSTTRTTSDIDTEIRKLQKERYELQPKTDKEAATAKRKADRLKSITTENGLTIHNLRTAGFTTKVVHIRNAVIPGVPVLVPVPTFLRKAYNFLGKGGATHIVISDSEDTAIAVNAVCHEIDNFDYKLGVKVALDNISPAEAKEMLTTGKVPTLRVAAIPQ